MAKKREIVKLSEEDYWNVVGEDHPDYILIEDTIVNFDQEKSFAVIDFVVRRESDNKFFSGTYTSGPGDYDNDYELIEVFPKKVTIQKYE